MFVGDKDMSSEILKEIYAPESILFLGSGFSRGARNIRGQNLPTGRELRRNFAKMLNVDPDQYNLQTLADEIASRQDLNLYQILYETFTVRNVQEYQNEILKLPWSRIYTTNYDDAIEFSYLENRKDMHSFTYRDRKPSKLPPGSIIHLHGMIRSTTEDNILDQLVMNEESYVRQNFEKSLWYDDFVRDLRFCNACFFVGYSLNDYHISALLLRDEIFQRKTYFITPEEYDPIFANRIQAYGIVLQIGVEGFADVCRTRATSEVTGGFYDLKAFRYLDPFKDKKTISPPTSVEILNLVTYGTFNYQRCLSTLPNNEYIVSRQQAAEKAVDLIESAHCLLVHSRIGNGKTIFLYILAHKLSERGYHCFMCHSNPQVLQRDIDLLQTFKDVVIFFDSYNSAVDIMEQLSNQLPEAKFIVAVRTGIQEARLHEMQSRLPSPLQRVNLNGLRREDREGFIYLLDQSGVRTGNLERVINRCKDLREVVLTLYKNQAIKDKIRDDLEPLLQDNGFKEVFIASHLLKWSGQDIDLAFLRAVTHRDAYVEIANHRETSGDIFKLDDDQVVIRSAVFSEYLIQNHLSTQDIIESVYKIIVEAVKRKDQRRYRTILSGLMRFSFLNRALRRDSHRSESLILLFERLRRDIDVNQEPLFWLQYSILMTDANDLSAAERFIETSYERASSNPNFLTFQIDTYALRLFLLIERSSEEQARVIRFDKIMEKMERVRLMIREESHRYHAIEVLREIKPFVFSRVSVLSVGEMNALVYHISLMVEELNRLSTDDTNVRESLIRAKEWIITQYKARSES